MRHRRPTGPGARTRLLLTTLATLLVAGLAGQLASAAPPVLNQVGSSGGKVTASWTLPAGVEAKFIEVSQDPSTNNDGGFICCGGPFFENSVLDKTQTSWTGTRTLTEPGTYHVHVSGLDSPCFFAGNCPVREWTEIKSFTFGDPPDPAKAGIPPDDSSPGPIESIYVAELREVAKDVEAALASVKTVSGASSGLTWIRQTPKVNPGGGDPPDNWTVSASDGQIQVTVTDEPQAAFTGTWDSPPQQVVGGTDFVMNVSVNGQITSGTRQGFRHLDLIEIINGRWTRAAVGAAVNCVDPIGAEPLSCTGPDSGTGTFTFGFPTSGDTYAFGVGALNCSACFVEYTYVAQTKETTLAVASQTLAAAIARAKAMLKTYQRANKRHGTSEEHRLVNQIMSQLAAAGGMLGRAANTPVRTTPKQRGKAKKILRQIKPLAAAAAAGRWPGLEQLEELIKNPRTFNRLVKNKAISRLEDIIDRNKGKIVGKALRGIPIRIGVPLRTQVRWAAEDFLLSKLGPGLLSIGPGGLVFSFFGQQISVAIKDMALAARPTGKVERRVNRTLKGFANREAELQKLRGDVDSNLSRVRDAVFSAQGAHRAASHLRRDLKALVKRRCKNKPNSTRCEGAQKSRARLIAADKRLVSAIERTSKIFLIGREFDEAELRSQIKGLCALQTSVKRINAKLS